MNCCRGEEYEKLCNATQQLQRLKRTQLMCNQSLEYTRSIIVSRYYINTQMHHTVFDWVQFLRSTMLLLPSMLLFLLLLHFSCPMWKRRRGDTFCQFLGGHQGCKLVSDAIEAFATSLPCRPGIRHVVLVSNTRMRKQASYILRKLNWCYLLSFQSKFKIQRCSAVKPEHPSNLSYLVTIQNFCKKV